MLTPEAKTEMVERLKAASTNAFRPMLDRAAAVERASGLIEVARPMLHEAINYSTQAFARIAQTRPDWIRPEAFTAPVILFRHIIETTDAIEASLSNSCVDPAKMMLRGSFEAALGIKYICEANTDRRALAWIYNNVRDRIRWYTRIHDGELSDDFMRDIPDEILARVDQELGRLQRVLDAPYMRDVLDEVQRQEKYRRWYSLWDGPNNLWELAQHLGWLDDYETLYRRWSSEAHASGGFLKTFRLDDAGKGSIMPVRSPVDMESVASYARWFLLDALRVLIDRFRPGEEVARAEWHETMMRPLKQELHGTSFTFDVTPYKW